MKFYAYIKLIYYWSYQIYNNIHDVEITNNSRGTETLFENEVKLSDVISSSLEDYNPKVGDKVEEIEKELNWSIDKKITDPITGEQTVEKIIDENEVKEIIKDNNDNGIDTKLNTEWVEQSIVKNI